MEPFDPRVIRLGIKPGGPILHRGQGVLLIVSCAPVLMKIRASLQKTHQVLNLGFVICARLSSYISRLGLSDQREIAPVVYSSLAFLYTACESVHQISCASCVQLARLSIQLATRSIRSA